MVRYNKYCTVPVDSVAIVVQARYKLLFVYRIAIASYRIVKYRAVLYIIIHITERRYKPKSLEHQLSYLPPPALN